ncbi:MAG TPA: class I SAM-dependent methyltransferase [Bacteroidia bacterium]|nr:class I SAM-dependent methyltransferase [Bacteroidia bacterium]
MNDLEKYFRNNPGRLIHKCMQYFDVYETYFSKYRGKELVLLEIGVSHGGSLQMWKHYFGDNVKIYGLDINPECKKFEEPGIKIFTGSQSDRSFLKTMLTEIPPIDVLIDDGGHTMQQQIITFEEAFHHVKKDGIYICEDLHTSYWLKYGGGHKRKGTFVEYSKNFIDKLNAYYSEQSSFKADAFTKSVRGVHFYNGMVVIEKGEIIDFSIQKTGVPALSESFGASRLPKQLLKPANAILFVINSILRFFRLPGIIWK